MSRRMRPVVAALAGVLLSSVLAGCGGSTAPSADPTTPGDTGTAAPAPTPAPAIFPLTGRRAPSQDSADRPTLSIKIDNVEGAWPQAGLNRADIVFDILVEGGLTRLMAVYQSQEADLVGPVRSGRPADAYLLRLFGDGFFAFSGSSPEEFKAINKISKAIQVVDDTQPGIFFRRSDHAAPHNLFGTTASLRAAAEKKGDRPASEPIFERSAKVPRGAPTTSVTVKFPAARAAWTWNGKVYLRDQDGRPDKLMSGAQVNSDNVVVMAVKIEGTGIIQTGGVETPMSITIGKGKVWVMRNGVRVEGTWNRTGIDEPLIFKDANGAVIPLAPGRTWVELLPNDREPTFQR